MSRKLLITGAILNLIIGAGHIATLFKLDLAFKFTGIEGLIEKYAGDHPGLDYTITTVVAILFIIMGLYGLSGARILKKFPLLKPAIIAITIVYLVRGVLGLAYEILSQEQWLSGIILSSVALFIGICYFAGGIWRWHGKGRPKYFNAKG